MQISCVADIFLHIFFSELEICLCIDQMFNICPQKMSIPIIYIDVVGQYRPLALGLRHACSCGIGSGPNRYT